MRLTIKDFSVLKDVDINLDDVTVIIGEQASGKSLTARVLFFFANNILPSLNRESQKTNFEINEKLTNAFYQIFHKTLCNKKDFSIKLYELFGNKKPTSVTFNSKNSETIFAVPEELKEVIRESFLTTNELEETLKEFFPNPNSYVRQFINRRLLEDADDVIKSAIDLIYIPAGRSFFSTIQKNIFLLTDNKNFVLDPTIRKFGQDYQVAKEQLKNSVSLYHNFDRIAEKIIKGEWMIDEEDKEFIANNGRQTPLANASSGQQEALPLVLMLENELLAANDEKKANKIIVIEEPEAHLFPASQRAIVDLIFQVKKQCPHVKFLITTHSPYILTCINNEIMKAKRDKVTVGVDSYFMADGVSTRIFDDETGLINGEKLDEISGEIADEFYALLENEA